MDAVSNRVTTPLFPVEDLLHILDIGKTYFSLQPLYAEDMLQYYYLSLESTLTTDTLVIHIPFKSVDVFQVYQTEGFHSQQVRQQ